jgi:hypothetical protein
VPRDVAMQAVAEFMRDQSRLPSVEGLAWELD